MSQHAGEMEVDNESVQSRRIRTSAMRVVAVCFALLLSACGSGTVSSTAASGGTGSSDTTAPIITINTPTSAASYASSSATLTLAGTASDAVGVTQVSWTNSLGGNGTASGATSWSISNIPLVSGTTPNLITVTARDAAGNIGTDTVSVSYSAAGGSDTTAPVITITAPSLNPSYTSSSATLTLAGTASDAVGVTQVSWANSLGGSGTAIGTANWSVGSIALVSGATPNLITVTARDAAGNISTDTISVSYGAGGGSSNTFYISPTGLDSNNGTSDITPWKTFDHAFLNMAPGDELILLDGTYSVANGTGYISSPNNNGGSGANSRQPPSGTGLNNVTRVSARNPGSVTILGDLLIGTSARKDSYITIQGITFRAAGTGEGGGSLHNTSYVTLKDCGFNGSLAVGTNDHNMGNTYALLEDIWIWGNARVMLIVYRSDHVVVRRAVTRNDGCLTPACGSTAGGNAMVGTTIYNSHDVSFQNVIAVDNVLGPAGFGGASDFSIAWHNNFFYPFHRNEWLGTMSVNTGLGTSYYYDIDNLPAAFQPMATYRDIVAINTQPAPPPGQSGVSASGLSLNMNCGSGCPAHNISVRNATLKTVNFGSDPSTGIYVNPNLASGDIDLQNIIVFGGGSTGVSSPDAPKYMDVYGFDSTYAQSPCPTTTSVCYTSNPTADGATSSLKYPTRIESGSLLKGSGAAGADIGATVLNRYGTDGTRHLDVGYNTLTSTPLWPWPNEARIKQQMCASETRGFCAGGTRLDGINPVTLTSYIWEQLGYQIPSGIYPP